jgi:thioredoxin-like negative regulator of GroEL
MTAPAFAGAIAVLMLLGAMRAEAAPAWVEARLLEDARMWLARGRPALARAQLDKLLAIDAEQPQALLMLAQLELASARPDKARSYADRLQACCRSSAAAQKRAALLRPQPVPPQRPAAAPARPLRAAAAPRKAQPSPAAEPAVRESAQGEPQAAYDVRAAAEQAARQGRIDDAATLLAAALAADPGLVWVRHDLARLYLQQENPAGAEALMAQALGQAPADPDVRLAAALVAQAGQHPARVLELLSGLDDAQVTPAVSRLRDQARFELLVARARQSADADLLELAWDAAGGDADRRRRVLELWAERSRRDEALLKSLADRLPAGDIESGLAVAKVLASSEPLRARQWLEQRFPGAERAPAEALLALAALDARLWDLPQAQRRLQQAEQQARTAPVPGRDGLKFAQAVADTRRAIEARQAADSSVGWRHDMRPGDGGRSRFSLDVLFAERAWRIDDARQWGLHADLLHLANGAGDRAQGLSMALSGSTERLQGDVGIVGLGWPRPRIAARLNAGYRVGAGLVEMELSRRPVTDSVKSLAGVAGEGGTEGAVDLSQARLGWTASAGAAWQAAGWVRAGLLAGSRVASNRLLGLGAELSRRRPARERLWLAGLSLEYTRYARNEDGFDHGDGGYYSPQQWLTVGAPIEFQSNEDPWSWQLRAVPSWAHARTDGLYSAADGGSASGSSSSGFGLTLRLDAARRLSAGLELALQAQLSRSAGYALHRIELQLRHTFDRLGAADPVLTHRPYTMR